MTSLEEYLLTCPEKTFKKLYLDSLNAGIDDFTIYEKARCIRHLSIYTILTLNH